MKVKTKTLNAPDKHDGQELIVDLCVKTKTNALYSTQVKSDAIKRLRTAAQFEKLLKNTVDRRVATGEFVVSWVWVPLTGLPRYAGRSQYPNVGADVEALKKLHGGHLPLGICSVSIAREGYVATAAVAFKGDTHALVMDMKTAIDKLRGRLQ